MNTKPSNYGKPIGSSHEHVQTSLKPNVLSGPFAQPVNTQDMAYVQTITSKELPDTSVDPQLISAAQEIAQNSLASQQEVMPLKSRYQQSHQLPEAHQVLPIDFEYIRDTIKQVMHKKGKHSMFELDHTGEKVFVLTTLGKRLLECARWTPQIVARYPNCDFCPQVQLLIETVNDGHINELDFTLTGSLNVTINCAMFNQWTDQWFDASKQRSFTAANQRHTQMLVREEKELKGLVGQLFKSNSRLQVVYVQLEFETMNLSPYNNPKSELSLCVAGRISSISKFIQKTYPTIFLGGNYKLFSVSDHLALGMFLFFNDDDYQHDHSAALGDVICHHWHNTITNRLGCAVHFNLNAEYTSGLGLIDRNHSHHVEYLYKAISNFIQMDHYVRVSEAIFRGSKFGFIEKLSLPKSDPLLCN